MALDTRLRWLCLESLCQLRPIHMVAVRNGPISFTNVGIRALNSCPLYGFRSRLHRYVASPVMWLRLDQACESFLYGGWSIVGRHSPSSDPAFEHSPSLRGVS